MAVKNKVEAARISAAGILFVHKGKFLLVYRSTEVTDPSLWCGAGGKIEQGESPEEAALREAQEEIAFPKGHSVELAPLFKYESDDLVFYNFLGILHDDTFQPFLNWESDGYAWFTPDKLPNNLHYGFEAIMDDKDARSMLEDALQPTTV